MNLRLPSEILFEIISQCKNLQTLNSLCITSREFKVQARMQSLITKYKGINKALEIVVIRACHSFLKFPLTKKKAEFWEQQCQNLINSGADINHSIKINSFYPDRISILRLVNSTYFDKMDSPKIRKIFAKATASAKEKIYVYICMNHSVSMACVDGGWCVKGTMCNVCGGTCTE